MLFDRTWQDMKRTIMVISGFYRTGQDTDLCISLFFINIIR